MGACWIWQPPVSPCSPMWPSGGVIHYGAVCKRSSGHLWGVCRLQNSTYIKTFFFLNIYQRIRATVNTQEQKRLLMDLDISMRTVDCFYTVTFYGALFREVRGCCYTAPWVCACPLNAQNCLKPPLFPTAKMGWLRWCKGQLLQEAAGPFPCCSSRCPSMSAVGWVGFQVGHSWKQLLGCHQ